MDATATLEERELEVSVEPPRDRSLRRFTISVAVGWALVTVPYLWILTDLWNASPTLFRNVLPRDLLSNFYDLQARAMFHGHLYVANGALGQEAFVHAGRQYTYFGLFPSILRMPILLFTHALDGRLSASSILLAWLVTGIFSSMVLWRVRLLIRGPVILGRAEGAMYGVLVATIMGGSILLNLAANPWVYSEDIAWSSALVIASLFALLGVLESPSWWRVSMTGLMMLAVNLTRGSAGFGCVIGAFLAATWFLSGRAGKEQRRWWWPTALAGLLPLLASFAVSLAKFGVLSGYPLHDQIYFNTHLAAIKGSYFSLRYLPTGFVNYVGSLGMHFSSTFPFVTLPLHPARAVGNVPLFGTEEVPSVSGSMPLLLLLSIWGLVAAFRPRPRGKARLTAVPLVAAAVPAGAILIFGFLDARFVGDFLPFLVLGSCVGAVDLWARLEKATLSTRGAVLGVGATLALFSIGANVAMSITPTGWWSSGQARRFVEFQKSVGDLTGHSLVGSVVQVKSLPNSAPLDELFATGNCNALWIYPTTGINNWLLVEMALPSHQDALCRSLMPRGKRP